MRREKIRVPLVWILSSRMTVTEIAATRLLSRRSGETE